MALSMILTPRMVLLGFNILVMMLMINEFIIFKMSMENLLCRIGSAPLEPSNLFLQNRPGSQNVVVYLSNDNTQFLVNPNGGAFTDTGDYAPWNTETTNAVYPFTNGVMPFKNDNDAAIISGGGYWSAKINSYNIRSNSGYFPSTADITQNAVGDGITFQAPLARLPFFELLSNRRAQVLYHYGFPYYRSSSQLAVKSFVASYVDVAAGQGFSQGDSENLVPFFDSVLSGQSGINTFLPPIISGDTSVWIEPPLDSDYNFLDSTSASPYPAFDMILGWSVPCGGAVGC